MALQGKKKTNFAVLSYHTQRRGYKTTIFFSTLTARQYVNIALCRFESNVFGGRFLYPMEHIKVFNNPQFGEIRTAGTADAPMFCASDICKALGYKNPRKAIADHADEGDVTKRDTPTDSGTQSMLYVNESGLYSLIFGSKLKTAKAFKYWVTSEVLPAIRKTGGYMVAKPDESPEEIMARALLVANDTINRSKERIAALEQENRAYTKEIAFVKTENETLRSKQTYLDAILQSRATVLVTAIAQDYGMSAVAFNKKLEALGIQRKVRGQWILFGKYLNQGYVHSHTVNITHKDGTPDVKLNTEWTQKGRIFLYNELKGHNILPLIER